MSTTVTTSCKDDSSLDTADVDTSVVIPTMLTRDVETLISDSGVTRYRIVTPIWYVYDEVEEPYWRFPEGLNLDKYDNFFRTEATVRADSAIYLKRKQTWQLDGNVSISNVMNEKFLTQQLFWDQRTHKLYSDSFIHIERTDRVLEGYGFESNEQLTRYTIKKVSGIFPASEFKSKGRQAEEEPADSVETEN
ncbi:MAG: LPS export ABC transporter periplasmic protein LptC, partial [Paramuribaculum sp.]|nr:LPS export ABC transporter periplasmic protein LptC [Paramuribaculum sp.]